MSGLGDLKNHMYEWNIRFPIDRWFRQKYKIPIFSEKHRASCFVDMMYEFIEDDMYINLGKAVGSGKGKYVPGSGDFLVKHEMSVDELNEAFDSIKI